LLSANLTRTSSQTRKYVLIVETGSAPLPALARASAPERAFGAGASDRH
jgi:hypothetical protein